MIFPLLGFGPEISVKGDFGVPKREFKTNWLTIRTLKDSKVKSKLEWYGSGLVFLHDSQLLRMKIEVGELSFKDEGVTDDMFSVVGGLKRIVLLALHFISIRKLANR